METAEKKWEKTDSKKELHFFLQLFCVSAVKRTFSP